MSRSSEPVLRLLRDLMARRKLNTAAVAAATGLERAHLRRVLAGSEPMLVDELLALGQVLEITPEELALPIDSNGPEDPISSSEAMPRVVSATAVEEPADDALGLDPWGNHPEQLFRAAFELGCDFLFLARIEELADSRVPAEVLSRYEGRDLPIRLDAAYHKHNNPRFEEGCIRLALSFDAIYECTFPWTSIRQVVFFPAPPVEPKEEDDEETSRGPVLRLVT